MKKVVDKVVNKLKYDFSLRKTTLTAQDLMMPGELGFSGIQFIVMSRVFDINAYRKNQPFEWHTTLNEYNHKRELSKDEKDRMDHSFSEFIRSIDSVGLDLEKYPLVCNRKPISLLNGTHRLAYYISEKKDSNICLELRSDEIYFPLDGIKWLDNLGLPNNKIELLKDGLNNYCSKQQYELALISEKELKKSIIEETVLNTNGMLKEINFSCKSVLEGKSVYIYKIVPSYQELYWSDKYKGVKSKVADRMYDDFRKTNNFGSIWIANTMYETKEKMKEINPVIY